MSNCNVDSNSVSDQGGAIWIEAEICILVNTVFHNNSAGTDGGSLYFAGTPNGANLTMVNSDITMSSAGNNGGAIWMEGEIVTLVNAVFQDNSAKADGGSIYFAGNGDLAAIANSDVSTSSTGDKRTLDTVLHGNSVTAQQAQSALLTIVNSDIATSSAGGQGGAIWTEKCFATLLNTMFNGNSAGSDGGSLCIMSNTSLTVVDSDVSTSSATTGGAIYLSTGLSAILENVSLSGNTGTTGGALYAPHVNLTMSNCNVDSNSVSDQGGAFWIQGGFVALLNTIFEANSAGTNGGGALYLWNVNTTVSNCGFFGNSASSLAGGAILSSNGDMIILDTDFNDNVAGDTFSEGGAIFTSNDVITLSQCGFDSNSAAGGGAVYGDMSDLIVSGCNFTNSTAFNGGGGSIKVEGCRVALASIIIEDSTALEAGGGIMATSSSILAVRNISVYRSQASSQGGALSSTSKTEIRIISGTFEGNVAGDKGGAMYTAGSSNTLEILDSDLSGNLAVAGGGGMYIGSGTVSQVNIIYQRNLALSAVFEVTSNIRANCSTIGNCLYSTNYPENYDNNEYCSFRTTESGRLSVVLFATESGYDYLKVNGVRYSGDTSPDAIEVAANSEIIWNSSGTINDQGFEICFANGANGGAINIAGGTNSMKNIEMIENTATEYGGGFYISSGENTLENVVMTNNGAQSGGTEYYFNGGSLTASDLSITSLTESSIGGTSSASAVCASTCGLGQSGNCSVSSSAPSCFMNCKCSNCTPGFASSTQYSSSPSDCVACGSGFYAHEDGLTTCTDCPIGKFATDDESDFGGGLVSQTVSQATTCNKCPAGYFADVTGTFVCTACDAGKISKAGSWNCSDCPLGKISESGDTSCTNCKKGTYSYIIASSICINCDTSKTSSPGSDVCDQAEPGFYLLDEQVEDCPEGADCIGGYLTPIPQAGYWMDRSKLAYTRHAYPCPRETCTGSGNNTCWTVGAIENQTCNADKLMCKTGAVGHLCGSCKDGYSYNTDTLICESCQSQSNTGIFILAGIGLFILLIMALKWNEIIKIPALLWDSYPVMIFRHLFKSGSLKVLVSAYQIIQSVTLSMEVAYPKVFSVSLTWLNFLTLDTPGLECSGVGVYGRVYFASISPMVMAAITLVIAQIRIMQVKQQKLNMTNTKKGIDKINAQHAWFLLFLSYLVVPPVTGKQLKALDCFPFSATDGSQRLRLDTNIDCESDSHNQFIIVDCLLLLIYLSIPMIWLVLLYRQRDSLWPPGISDESIIIQRRRVESDLLVLRFLFDRYKPSMACFESLDIARRILFVGVIPLMAASSMVRSAIGLGFALVSMILYRELTPFMSAETNVVAYIADIVIYLTFASALMIETGLSGSMDDFTFGLILVAVNFSILVTAITSAFFRTLLDKEQSFQKKEKFVKQIEDATEFTHHKFATTFDVINRTLITPTHCAIQYYASLQEIKHILRHGIPMNERFSSEGLVFTMHQPHNLDELDRSMFSAFEAVLVLSLPKRALKQYVSPTPVAMNDDDDYSIDDKDQKMSALWTLPRGLLSGLRGSYFNDVMDPELWEEGVLILPPQVIKRAYQLDRNAFSEEIGFHFTSTRQLCDPKTYSYQSTPAFPLMGNTELTDLQKLVMFEPEEFPIPLNKPIPISNINTYLNLMTKVRQHCAENNLIPVYHYTRPEFSSLIIKGGFKMSTNGQGDGGVSFLTYGPASFDIGSPHYEENVVLDCFGRDRVEEFRGQHRVDICVVYGIDPMMADKALNNLHHSTMIVPQEYFQDFSLNHPDGTYFLRMDRVLACFDFDARTSITGLDAAKKQINLERIKDTEVTEIMQFHDMNKKQNEKLIGELLHQVAPHVHIVWAVTFGGTKINTLLDELDKVHKSETHSIYYHYGTLAQIEQYVRCGIPVLKQTLTKEGPVSTSNFQPLNHSAENNDEKEHGSQSKGILFTLHRPDYLSDEEIQLFGNCEAFVTCLLPNKLLFPHKTVMVKRETAMSRKLKNAVKKVRALRKVYSVDLGVKDTTSLCSDLYYLPTEVLTAMRGSYHEKVLDPIPWYEGIVLLPPQCLKSAYQIMSEENIAAHLPCILDSRNCIIDKPMNEEPVPAPVAAKQYSFSMAPSASIVPIGLKAQDVPLSGGSIELQTINGTKQTIKSRIEPFVSMANMNTKISKMSHQCLEHGLYPLFHYTDYRTAISILRRGFKVFRQGRGGGVYFTTKKPTSYDLGSHNFEDQIIIDFFGEGILDEYRGKQKVDVCIVYGMESLLIESSIRKRTHSSSSADSGGSGGGTSGGDDSDHLRSLSREVFKDFSNTAQDNNYYLRPDRILGAFLLTTREQPTSPHKLHKPQLSQSKENDDGSASNPIRVSDMEITEEITL